MNYLASLERDYHRLAEVAQNAKPDAAVPTCPEWTMSDLVEHVAMVYLHKVASMRLNAPPPWPPVGLPDVPPLERLHSAYAKLITELTSRDPASPSHTWYGPDQTVGFWFRRMAQETVIHRIDAELAAGVPSHPVPDDLAVDGVDEVLKHFLAYSSREWLAEFTPILSNGDGAVGVTAGERRWLVSWSPTGVTVTDQGGPADAELIGEPDAMLRWLWRRTDGGLTVDGDAAHVTQMRELLKVATQ